MQALDVADGHQAEQALSLCMVCVQAERRRAAEAAAEMEAAARAEAARLVLEKQLQQEADLQQVTCCLCLLLVCLLSISQHPFVLCGILLYGTDAPVVCSYRIFRVFSCSKTARFDSARSNACALQNLNSQSRPC